MLRQEPFEAIVIGSGFAGAVTACRLAQAGVDVCLLERGRRYEADDFPTYPFASRRLKSQQGGREADDYEPPRDFSRWLWRVDQGLWEIHDLGRIKAVQAAGYGGGSLVYVNVHLRAPRAVFETQAKDAANGRLWPTAYSRAPSADKNGTSLDDYYDLAAFMLDVQPFPQDEHQLAKTRRLRDAAEDDNWFLPPLAVNFSPEPRTRRLHDRQGRCDLRGFCSIGCGIRAKNTLDLNYLAIAENPTLSLAENPAHEAGTPRAVHVVTLAEVSGIERSGSSAEEFPFTVTYHDLLLKSAKTVQAKWVFLCAGALNTTKLLRANQDGLRLREATHEWLGRGYYPNGDELAVVFDCEKPHEVDRGPTITSALQYDIDGNWFLVEDGGVPDELDLVLGVFRSPLLLRRNRYREHDQNAPEQAVRRYWHQRSTGARELLATLPPHGAEPVQGVVGPKFPEWLKKAVKASGAQLLQRLSIATEPLAQQTLDQLALYLQSRLDEVAEVLPNGKELLQGATKLGLARGLLRLGAQLLWGSESDAVRRSVEVLLRAVPRNLDETTRAFVSVLRWCADYRPGDGRTGVLLTLGRDSQPTTLKYDPDNEDDPLSVDEEKSPLDAAGVAEVPDAKDRRKRAPLHATQERVFRDIARKWKGELRTNPAWTLARSRVTVHSQGGCRMSDSEGFGVTDKNGEVFGCEGLYVMDAAAFPSPVGVNPSATIAAVAERKVESFIRKHYGKSDWRAPEWDEARAWAKKNGEMLDPLAHVGVTKEAKAEVIGLTFEERMRGYYSSIVSPEPGSFVSGMRSEVKDASRGLSRASLNRWLARFATAELKGIRKANDARAAASSAAHDLPRDGEIAVELRAKIEDLTAFLDVEYSRKPTDDGVAIELGGAVFFGKDARPREDSEGSSQDKRQKHAITRGTLRLFRAARAKRRKALEYMLEFEYWGKPYRLHGLKVIEDDPRLDVWHDTSTLNFDIEDLAKKEKKWRGLLRLPAAELLKAQVKSFEITGTDDPDRKIWALGAFLAFFLGHLVDSYVPELKGLPPLLRNVLLRTHG